MTLCNHDSERSVLGGILANSKLFGEVAAVLEASDFESPKHVVIFEAFTSLQSSIPPKPIDTVMALTELKRSGNAVLSGGALYLADLEDSCPTSANTIHYAKEVKELSVKRQLLTTCEELTKLANDPKCDAAQLLDEAQRRVFAVSEKRQEGDLKVFSSVLDNTLAIIDKLRESGTGITGLSTGLAELDRQLTGLHGGELIILAARPGCGKTSLAMNIASHAALRCDTSVAVFSLEMPEDQLATRFLASESRVSMKRIREGRLSGGEMDKIQHHAALLWNIPLFIDDSGSLSSFELQTKVRRLQSKIAAQGKPRLGLIVVDYLQLMHQRGSESRQLEVSEISRSLKCLAKDLDVPVIALSQLNRKIESRGGKGKPMLSDLRESGAIEQDADVVMFIHKESTSDKEEASAPADGQGIEMELVIAKQRNGSTGSIPLIFFGSCVRFESMKYEGTRK